MADDSLFPGLCADLLRSGQSVRFRATGQSMGPTIRDGDMLTIAPVDPGELRRGDVVLYESDRGLTAHRVVRIAPRSESFVTRGDAPGSQEEGVAVLSILGRVDAVERDGVPQPLNRTWLRRLSRVSPAIQQALARWRA